MLFACFKVMLRLAINGFGRIGRTFFRVAFGQEDIEIVAINDLGDIENLVYLLRRDTVYRLFDKEAEVKDGALVVDGRQIKYFQEKDPAKLPWKDLEIDVVVESTGVFTSSERAKAHISAGAKRVVITAPAKDDVTPTVTPSVNLQALNQSQISSNASCTTNAVVPVMAVMSEKLGIAKAMLSTIHAYTATQGVVDGPNKNFKRGRAAAQNVVPSSTGAALATAKVLPSLKNIFDGISFRVPVVCGSVIDLVFLSQRKTSVEEVKDIIKEAASQEKWQGILGYTEEPLVSSDILSNPHGSVVDLSMIRVVDGDLVKIVSWYDNEWGYCQMLLRHIREVGKLLNQ